MRRQEKMREQEDRAYEFICAVLAERGYAPTRREVLEHVGLKSTSSAERVLSGLRRRGLIWLEPRRSNGIRLVKPTGDEWDQRLGKLAARIRTGGGVRRTDLGLVALAVDAVRSGDEGLLLALAVAALERTPAVSPDPLTRIREAGFAL